MILLDSSIIIDLFQKDSRFKAWADRVVIEAVSGPGASVNPVIMAESLQHISDRAKAIEELRAVGITFLDLPIAAAEPAAVAYASYLENRRKSGSPPPLRKTPLPDFLIGAHALCAGFTVATRDPARFGTYFSSVELQCP